MLAVGCIYSIATAMRPALFPAESDTLTSHFAIAGHQALFSMRTLLGVLMVVPLPGSLSGQAESRISAHEINCTRHNIASKHHKYAQPLQASQSLAFSVVSKSPGTETMRPQKIAQPHDVMNA